MSTGNEDFRLIKGLLPPLKCDLGDVYSGINNYIDTIQGIAEVLESDFAHGRYSDFARLMDKVLHMLRKVYARRLATDGEILLRHVKYDRLLQAKKLIKPFITELLSLSIEMQKTLFGGEIITFSEMEKHAEMAGNLSAVGKLIAGGDYEQAESMITDLEGQSPEEMVIRLHDLIASQKYDEAAKLASFLEANHLDVLKHIGISADGSSAKKVMAVDDRPEILSSISDALNGHFKVFCATSGETALKILPMQRPDIFILDIEMPGMNGYELAQAIRRMEDYAKTPIIFLTGNSTREHVVAAMQAGANDFIVKPANHGVLLQKVGKFLA